MTNAVCHGKGATELRLWREGTTHVWFELDPGGTLRPGDPELG